MRYFALYDLQTVILLFFLGLTVLLLLYISLGKFTGSAAGRKDEEERYPGEIETRDNPIPPILVFVYAGFVIWAVVYVAVVGIRGVPF